jgi:DNA-binding transcriptional MocR family regulator
MESPAPISFARGAPSADIMPAAELRAAADRALAGDYAAALSYGPGYGYPPLRQWIAEKHGVEPERVVLFNGSLEAGLMLFDHLVQPGDPVIVEAPSYDRTLLALEARGAELFAVPLQADGIDVGALEAALAAGLEPQFAHIIPNFHNPAGCTLSLEKRERLLELAEEYDFLIFEDDPYRDVRFAGEDLPTMLSRDSGERVVYASSFSKTIAPGVRVGYLIGPQDMMAALTKQAVNTYISPNMLAQAIVGEFCLSGAIGKSIDAVKVALRERRDAVAEGLAEYIGDEARFVVPEGGYFLWVELGEDVDTTVLLAAAAERAVTFVAGSDFMLEGGTNALRLAYSAVTPEQATEGTKRLAEALESIKQPA